VRSGVLPGPRGNARRAARAGQLVIGASAGFVGLGYHRAQGSRMLLRTTTTALLDQLRDHDNHPVWEEFDRRYRPLLVGLGLRLGLTAQDAEDVAQETLVRFARLHARGKYDRSRGRLRSWLLGIARNCSLDLLDGIRRRNVGRGSSAIVELPDARDLDALWDEERRRVVLARGLDDLRARGQFDERTLQAFELVALERVPAVQVAETLGMSIDSVYAARSRCVKRLRSVVEEIEGLYEAD